MGREGARVRKKRGGKQQGGGGVMDRGREAGRDGWRDVEEGREEVVVTQS